MKTANSVTVNLLSLIDAIDASNDMVEFVIHLQTGDVIYINQEAMDYIDNDTSDYADWMAEDIKVAKDYQENPEGYLVVPTSHDVGEYQLMENFALSLSNNKIKNELLKVLRMRKPFRKFKDMVIMLGIDQEWYKYKDIKYREFAIDWCRENELLIEE